MPDILATLVQAEPVGWWDRLVAILDTPLPYSPVSEYLVVLLILWLIARAEQKAKLKETFDAKAQEVLDKKFEEGELSQSAYERFRQDVSLRKRR
jgi:hypothetical protein